MVPPTRCGVLPESRSCASTASVSRKLSSSIDAFITASTSLHILAPSVIYLEKHRLQSRAHLWNLLRQQHSRSLIVCSAAQECSQSISGGCIVGCVCASTAHCTRGARTPRMSRGMSCTRLWRCLAIPASALAPKTRDPISVSIPAHQKKTRWNRHMAKKGRNSSLKNTERERRSIPSFRPSFPSLRVTARKTPTVNKNFTENCATACLEGLLTPCVCVEQHAATSHGLGFEKGK